MIIWKSVLIAVSVSVLFGLCACGQRSETAESEDNDSSLAVSERDGIKDNADDVSRTGGSESAVVEADVTANEQGVWIPNEITEIPQEFFEESNQPGTLMDLDYETWESFGYEEHETELSKHAVVYLPYEYDENEQYDIFYLMHGGWSNENTTLGTPGQPNEFKNVLDNAIENGEIEPLIVVCPTYNNTNENGQDSDNFSLAMRLTDRYHNELLNDLIPAVESTYSTYAEDTTPEGIAASRDHRGFGGFSMGSVTTWHTFQYDLDYFRYFLPMSCGTSLDDETIWQAAESHDPSDYFVFVMTGTSDFAYSYDQSRTERMAQSDYFTSIDEDPDGNFAYRVKDGYSHDGQAAMEYTYNGLKAFFGGNRKGSGETEESAGVGTHNSTASMAQAEPYTTDSKISDVISDPVFGDYGRLLFPVDDWYWSKDTLGDLQLTWYNYINPERTVDIVNTLHSRAEAGETIFYDIYTDEEKAEDPEKEDTGLFFFKGRSMSMTAGHCGRRFSADRSGAETKDAKTAIINAGGGFAYVGAMQDSFPVALELSRKGLNAFALIYRPGAETACEDLSRAIAFLSDHADELGIDMTDYSLWGGSAGARMAAWVGTYGTKEFGEKEYPKPAAVIMQYTGLSEVTGEEPPTYACVGTSDGIASWRTMQARINAIKANDTNAEIDIFGGLPHGFGLGEGTVAEGWIDHAVSFWEENME